MYNVQSGSSNTRSLILRMGQQNNSPELTKNEYSTQPPLVQQSIQPPENSGEDILINCEETEFDISTTMISGAIAGISATMAKQPLVRVKWVRQVNDRGQHRPLSYGRQLGLIARNEGVRGLWRGSGTSCLRNTPHSAAIYTLYPQVYSQMEKLTKSHQHRDGYQVTIRLASGFMTTAGVTLFTHPLDTLRVRMATQSPGKIRYSSIGGAARSIVASEGPMAFYRGLWPTLLGAGPRGGIGFGVFETLKKLHSPSGEPTSALTKLSFGAMAGMASDLATYPLDTVRRRQQTFGWNRTLTEFESELGSSRIQKTRGVGRTLLDILRVEGIRGLYKGAGLSLFKTPIASALSFGVNDIVKDMLTKP